MSYFSPKRGGGQGFKLVRVPAAMVEKVFFVSIALTFLATSCTGTVPTSKGGDWNKFAAGMPDGFDIKAQYMEDRKHPPQEEKTKDKYGLSFYSETSQVLGDPKVKKLVNADTKIFPKYYIEPNRIVEPKGSGRMGPQNLLSKLSLDPNSYGMRGARARGEVPDAALMPSQELFSQVGTHGGPNLLYSPGVNAPVPEQENREGGGK